MKQKIYSDIDAIVADIPHGARIMFGGFGGAGFPNNLIQALERKGTKDIIAISNNCGTREGELGLLFKHDRIRHVIASFPGPHANYFQDRFAAKQVTLELVPQGILCERNLKGRRKFALGFHGGEQAFRHALGTAQSNRGALRLSNHFAEFVSHGVVEAVEPAPERTIFRQRTMELRGQGDNAHRGIQFKPKPRGHPRCGLCAALHQLVHQ